jgi:hypothetical protein
MTNLKKSVSQHAAELIGKRIGALVVTRYAGARNKRQNWECQCDCGNIKEFRTDLLRSVRPVQSCGCKTEELRNATRVKHGMHNSKEYTSWSGAKQRCYNPKCPEYPRYGGRGIVMDSRWLEGFDNFYQDMGPCPDSSMSLDRIDSNGDYGPGNCRWATPREQANNTSRNRYIVVRGTKDTLAGHCRRYGMTKNQVLPRLNAGVSPEQIFKQEQG